MQTESSANYYYRYKIKVPADLTSETVERRKKKATHNHADIMLFDWTKYPSAVNAEMVEKLTSNFEKIFKTTQLFSFEQMLVLGQPLKLNLENQKLSRRTHIHIEISDLNQFLHLDSFLHQNSLSQFDISIHFAPKSTKQLNSLGLAEIATHFKNYDQYVWSFGPYNKDIKRSLTSSDIGYFFRKHPELSITKSFKNGKINSLEIWNEQIPDHFELEPESVHCRSWHFETQTKNIFLSVIIPSYNNLKFLTNVLTHLIEQDLNPENYEIIVVEDGGTDGSFESIHLLLESFQNRINLRFIYWSKDSPTRGLQNFFRAGLARNLGARSSQADHLIFLDSDMLVPPNFIATSLQCFKNSDVIQFQRFHIHQQLSHSNPSYKEVDHHKDVYVEEPHYWSQLFNCHDWHQLPAFWKFTCTYALGVRKSDFIRCGRFKKYYVSYGFEDTDLGYELYRLNKKFKLVPLPLLHLTSYDQMQYKNSSFKRTGLLKKTAALFYHQHLDEEIFSVLENYFRFQKPLLNFFRDLL